MPNIEVSTGIDAGKKSFRTFKISWSIWMPSEVNKILEFKKILGQRNSGRDISLYIVIRLFVICPLYLFISETLKEPC